MRKFNDTDLRKATRMVTDDPEDCVFGIVWYEGKAQDGEWVAEFAGNDPDPEKAEAFLRGEDVTPQIRTISV